MADEADLQYLRNINTKPGPDAGRSINPAKPGPDVARPTGYTKIVQVGTLDRIEFEPQPQKDGWLFMKVYVVGFPEPNLSVEIYLDDARGVYAALGASIQDLAESSEK